jgi:transposase
VSRFRIPRRRPSAAMAVACCALFVALGGTSYAFAVGSIGTREIRDDSVRSIDVHNRSLKGNDLRADSVGGGAIKEETLDTARLDVSRLPAVPRALVADNASPQPLQVRVNLDGQASLRRGVSSVVHHENGRYTVTFERDVSDCVPAATLTDHLAYGDPPVAHSGTIVLRTGDGPNVFVTTADLRDMPADHDFFLLVSC